jgi:hypothetical protein
MAVGGVDALIHGQSISRLDVISFQTVADPSARGKPCGILLAHVDCHPCGESAGSMIAVVHVPIANSVTAD